MQVYVMRKIINYIKLFIIWTVFSIFTIYGIFYFLIGIPQLQNFIKNQTQTQLASLLNTEFTIGDIKIEPFNKLVLNEVCIFDRDNDTIANINTLSLRFDLLPLLNKDIVFNTILLSGFNFNLKKETVDSDFNFQFILDSFKSENTEKSEFTFALHLDNILLRRGNIRYDILTENEKQSGFDKNHIDIDRKSVV